MLPQQAAVGDSLAEGMKETPMYQGYAAIAPHPEDFSRLLNAMGEFMRRPYDWSDKVKKLSMPVMLVYGDSDMIRPEHIVSFYKLLGGGLRDAGWMREHMAKNRLAILPNVTHYEIGVAPALVSTVLPFLNGQGGPPGR
jgi:pimeloyl-ACP methyl ester carboxylesterase